MNDILKRRQTHFVLWCPKHTNPPSLVIGKIVNGNPPALKPAVPPGIPFRSSGIDGLWELDPATCHLSDGEVYHYWFEVDGDSAGTRIQVTDPLAHCVDYRLLAPLNPIIQNAASVIKWQGGKLIVCDANGERADIQTAPFDKLPANNQMVIYELPTAWSRSSANDAFERAVGTFRDILALIVKDAGGANFPDLAAAKKGNEYITKLGVNAIQLLPPADSIYARQWGYGTTHYLAPDYELGYPEGNLSSTANQDLTMLINACHQRGIRFIMDVVMGFMKDEPYRQIDLDDFYLEDPEKHKDDEDAKSSRFENGIQQLRQSFGGSSPRYVKMINTYDPVSGNSATISAARQLMLTFITRWLQDFQIDGIRIDSVENVANWDFIRDFRDESLKQFKERYATEGAAAGAKFIVVGEELTQPPELLAQNRLDGLWNEKFQSFMRAAILGQNCDAQHEPSFEWTVRKAVDCRNIGFSDGTKAINYLTSHDVQGNRKERLYNQLIPVLTIENSGSLFNRGNVEEEVKNEIRNENRDPDADDVKAEIEQRTDQKILHRARLRRIKLAFACFLTSVGIPMILAGEEFGDQHDLFDSQGHISQDGGKQVDPVNYTRADEPERKELLSYVSTLIMLRTSHLSLSVNDTDFIHVDFSEGKRVLAWKRGTNDPVVVVANFSDFTTPGALGAEAAYLVNNWPAATPGHHWFEVTQGRDVAGDNAGKEPVFAWEAKVYKLAPDL